MNGFIMREWYLNVLQGLLERGRSRVAMLNSGDFLERPRFKRLETIEGRVVPVSPVNACAFHIWGNNRRLFKILLSPTHCALG
jgi:hypothetical protein